jgi:hypothetical protein
MKSTAQKILDALTSKHTLEKLTVEHYDEQANDSQFGTVFRQEASRKRDEAERRAAVWSQAVHAAQQVIEISKTKTKQRPIHSFCRTK